MVYLKSVLAGLLVATGALLASIVLAIVVVVSQVHKTPGAEIGVDIRSFASVPVFWIAALVGFGIGFYWKFRRASRSNILS